jgi:SPP1 gp7 family putative phage head morphogenesis protein
MTLSKQQLTGIAQALENQQHSLKFTQNTQAEQKQIYHEYNMVKTSEIEEFTGELLLVALEVRDVIWSRVDEWATIKKQKQFTQAIGDSQDQELDFDDVLFLGSVALLVSSTVNEYYPINDLIKRIETSYNNAADYYTRKEFDSLLSYLRGKGFTVTRTGDQISISPPKHYPVKTSVQVTVPFAPTFSLTKYDLSTYYSDKTVTSYNTIGEKYLPPMKKAILEGYENGLSVDKIASKLKVVVDPENTGNETFYIYQRIANSESAFYTEKGKTHAHTSLNIQQWMYLTANDANVCPRCLPDHLRIFLITELTDPPPRHPWCRCTLIPIYKPKDLILFLMPIIFTLLLLYDDDDE